MVSDREWTLTCRFIFFLVLRYNGIIAYVTTFVNPQNLHSEGSHPLEGPQEVGPGVRPVHAAAALSGCIQCHQRHLLPVARPPLCHHHLSHLQVGNPGCAEVQRRTSLQVSAIHQLPFCILIIHKAKITTKKSLSGQWIYAISSAKWRLVCAMLCEDLQLQITISDFY